jgi:hypothetical protein
MKFIAGDEARLGMMIELLRGADLLDAAVVHGAVANRGPLTGQPPNGGSLAVLTSLRPEVHIIKNRESSV